MGWINTGYQRATTLTIVIKQNGVQVSSVVLPMLEAFTQDGRPYPALTSLQVAQLSDADYNSRVTDYAAYVVANYQAQYPGLTVSTNGAVVYNVISCPI